MENLLTISSLNKTYFSKKKDVEVLKNISLSIKDNEIVSLLGPSGCGKSTLLNIISSLDKDYEGPKFGSLITLFAKTKKFF